MKPTKSPERISAHTKKTGHPQFTSLNVPFRESGGINKVKSVVDALSRHERSKLFPGVHKDLIPAFVFFQNLVASDSQATTSQLSKAYSQRRSTRPKHDSDSSWDLDSMSDEELRDVYFKIADAGEAEGYKQAAENLRHFLDGNGRDLVVAPDWLMGFQPVLNAIHKNVEDRIWTDCKKIAARGGSRGTSTYYDHYDRGILAKPYTDLFYASNGSTLTSTGDINIEWLPDGLVLAKGVVYHHWHDRYDWHKGVLAPFRYKGKMGYLDDKYAQRLVDAGLAAPFDMYSQWMQGVEWSYT